MTDTPDPSLRGARTRAHARVSIIMPAFNAERFIREAIESVLAQTFSDYELIVVDDGSTDGTLAVVETYRAGTRVLRQPHAGVAAALNYGIRQSAGELVAFLAADDVWLPGFLGAVVEAFDARADVGAGYAWLRYMDPDGQPLPGGTQDRLWPDVLAQALHHCFALPSTLVVRRLRLDQVGLFDPELRGGEDRDLLIRLAAAGTVFACVPTVLVHKRLHPGALTSDAEEVLYWSTRVLEKAFSTFPISERYRWLKPQLRAEPLFRLASAHVRGGAWVDGIRRFVDGLEVWPRAAYRPEFTKGLLFRMLPVGQRKDTEVLRHLEELAGRTEQLLRGIVAEASSRGSPRLDLPLLWATFHATLALLYFRKRLLSRTVVHLLLGFRAQPWGVVRPLLGRDARVKWVSTALKTMVAHFRTPRRRSLVG